MDVEQRAREIFAEQFPGDCGYETRELILSGQWADPEVIRAIIAALTPPEESDHSLLELAATFETCIPFLPSAGQRNIGKAVAQLRHMAMGYVLVPVEPTEAMLDAHDPAYWGTPADDCGTAARKAWGAMLAARPEGI